MAEQELSGVSRILTALGELIGALDRRIPQVGRAGETRIAMDAQKLRRAALARIDELKRNRPGDDAYDQSLAEAIMTDDGGPWPARALSCFAHD